MNYSGNVDTWHGDENECHGHCGLCSDCTEREYRNSDNAYTTWKEEQES